MYFLAVESIAQTVFTVVRCLFALEHPVLYFDAESLEPGFQPFNQGSILLDDILVGGCQFGIRGLQSFEFGFQAVFFGYPSDDLSDTFSLVEFLFFSDLFQFICEGTVSADKFVALGIVLGLFFADKPFQPVYLLLFLSDFFFQ